MDFFIQRFQRVKVISGRFQPFFFCWSSRITSVFNQFSMSTTW